MSTQNVSVTLPSDVIYVSGTVNGDSYTWTNTDGNLWEAVVARSDDEKYTVILTLVNSLGSTTTETFILYYGILNLITDRTHTDVERWRKLRNKGWLAMTEEERTEWLATLKGSYNFSDMNRVESAVQYIADRFNEVGYSLFPVIKTTWGIGDIPSKVDMDRYFGNVAQLRAALSVYPNTPYAPNTDRKLDYQAANDLEQILIDVNELLTRLIQSSFYVGEVFSGEV